MELINEIKNKIKMEMNYGIDHLNLQEINNLKKLIEDIKGNIFISGIGKCETLAIHFVNILKSISYNNSSVVI